MSVLKIKKHVDSETLYLPELHRFLGKQVEITIADLASSETQESPKSLWDVLYELAGKDMVDPDAYKQVRAASMI